MAAFDEGADGGVDRRLAPRETVGAASLRLVRVTPRRPVSGWRSGIGDRGREGNASFPHLPRSGQTPMRRRSRSGAADGVEQA